MYTLIISLPYQHFINDLKNRPKGMWDFTPKSPWCSILHQRESKVFKLDNSKLGIKWMKKHPVIMVTTIHNDEVITTERGLKKPEGGRQEVEKSIAEADYNKFMGVVDTVDQLLSYYGFNHRTVHW